MNKELLAPAGDIESLYAAVHGGCDAVYLALKDFGARSFAKNFTREELTDAVKFCHLYGVKVYTTLNTLVKDDEVNKFLDDVDFLYNAGVDAVLVQDFGMMMLIREMYPDFPVHASTQFNNSKIETVKLLKDIGVERVVLSRELSLDEINAIDIDIEKEVFIHGALCISYSGNCLMSSMMGNRSGNRGECTGSCRLPYKLYRDNKLLKEGYLLSTKELNTSTKFTDLLNSNIKSYKIEGRMKSPEYVYFITRFYRNLIDGKKNNIEDIDTLKILFNREFTTGNLFNDSIMNTKSPNHIGLKIGEVIDISSKYIKIKLDRELNQEDGIRFVNARRGMIVNFLYDEKLMLTNKSSNICYVKNTIDLKEKDSVYLTSSKVLKEQLLNYQKRRVLIDVIVNAKVGEKLSIKSGNIEVFGDIVERSLKKPVTEEEIRNKISRLNDTVYQINNLDINMDNDIFIPISKINELRRTLVEELNNKRIEIKREGKKSIKFDKLDLVKINNKSIIVDNEEELKESSTYKRFYTKNKDLFIKYKDTLDIYLVNDRNKFDDKVEEKRLVSEYMYPNNSISDYMFNVTNIYTVYYLHKLGYKLVTLSVELSDKEIIRLIKDFKDRFGFDPNVEVVMNDRIEVMFIKGNIMELDKDTIYDLEDVKKRIFKVYFDGINTHILNYEVTNRLNHFTCSERYNYKYLK